MKYVFYTRKSKAKKVKNETGEWVFEEDPLSHHMQVEEILKYTGRDAEYIVFSESDVTRDGDLDKRPVLLEAINSLKKEDILIVWKSSRLTADQMALIQIMMLVEKKKAECYSVCEPEFFEKGAISEMMRTIITAVNKYEVVNIRNNVKAALQAKKAKGERVGYIPYGYRLEGLKMLAPDEIEQEMITLLEELYFERGYTYRKVAEYLNNEECWNREGLPWSYCSVYRILKNRLKHSVVFPQLNI